MVRLPADQRREQLTEAAIRVMTRDGVTKATTRAIVAEADISLSVFHYAFRSKQELLGAVIDRLIEQSATEARRGMEAVDRGATLSEVIRASLQAYWDHVLAYPEKHLLTYELTQFALRTPGFEDVARRQYAQYVAAHTDFLGQLDATFGARFAWPVPVLASYLAVFLDGVTLNWLATRDDTAADALLNAVATQVEALIQPARD